MTEGKVWVKYTNSTEMMCPAQMGGSKRLKHWKVSKQKGNEEDMQGGGITQAKARHKLHGENYISTVQRSMDHLLSVFFNHTALNVIIL